MRYCTNCGRELADNLKFCTRCGTPVEEDLEQGQEDLGQSRRGRLPVVVAALVVVLAVVGVGAYVILDNLSLPGDATSASPASTELESKSNSNVLDEGPESSATETSAQSSVPADDSTRDSTGDQNAQNDLSGGSPEELVQRGTELLDLCEQNGDAASGADALALFSEASKLGNTEADYYLGYCYYYSSGVSRDYTQAYQHFLVAAEAGDARGQAFVARCLYDGSGVAQDRDASYQWAAKAAGQGNPLGQSMLGSCYKHGYGVEKDLEKMLYWYELSADAGNDAGQLNMGACYDMGLGVPRDASRAVEYYKLSAAQGNSLAQLYLAKCYYEGDGVSRDVDLAASYANQAVNNVRDPKASADAAAFLNKHGL